MAPTTTLAPTTTTEITFKGHITLYGFQWNSGTGTMSVNWTAYTQPGGQWTPKDPPDLYATGYKARLMKSGEQVQVKQGNHFFKSVSFNNIFQESEEHTYKIEVSTITTYGDTPWTPIDTSDNVTIPGTNLVTSITWSSTKAEIDSYNNLEPTEYPKHYWYPVSLGGQLDQQSGGTYLFQSGAFSGGGEVYAGGQMRDYSVYFGNVRLSRSVHSGTANLGLAGTDQILVFRTYVDGVIDVEVGDYDSTHVVALYENRPLFSWTAGRTGKLTKLEFLIVEWNNPAYAHTASGWISKTS